SREIIDLYICLNLVLSKGPNLFEELVSLCFSAKCLKAHRCVVCQPRDGMGIRHCSVPIAIGVYVASNFQVSQSADIIEMGFAGQQVLAFSKVLGIFASGGKMR